MPLQASINSRSRPAGNIPVGNTSALGSILQGHDLIPCPSKLLVFLTSRQNGPHSKSFMNLLLHVHPPHAL
uniref:Uncharacterized protein n=1 Tax=Coturnix japonica TaxID=93934 RepID=A0A8C2T298_COTJA